MNFFATTGLKAWGSAVKTAGTSEIIVIDINFIYKQCYNYSFGDSPICFYLI